MRADNNPPVTVPGVGLEESLLVDSVARADTLVADPTAGERKSRLFAGLEPIDSLLCSQ